jgi:hypothetical protein
MMICKLSANRFTRTTCGNSPDIPRLQAVQAGLLATVHHALEPKHVSIWIARR